MHIKCHLSISCLTQGTINSLYGFSAHKLMKSMQILLLQWSIGIVPILLLKTEAQKWEYAYVHWTGRKRTCDSGLQAESTWVLQRLPGRACFSIQRHFPGSPKCKWFPQLMILAPGQWHAHLNCSQTPKHVTGLLTLHRAFSPRDPLPSNSPGSHFSFYRQVSLPFKT